MGANDNLLGYIASCKAVAVDYIERSTRFNVKDVQIVDASAAVHKFVVTIVHRLDVASEVHDHHGQHAPGAGDFSTADWSWYQQEVQAQANAELKRTETIDALIGSVSSQRYAAMTARTHIRTHPRRLFHPYTCDGCRGHGEVNCGNCSGKGKVACGGCHGNGKVHCSWCHGAGSTTQTRQVTDYNGYVRTETQQINCGHCWSGRVNCSVCGGSGKRTCGTCGGRGKVTCTGCSGHGCLTKITATHTYSTPEFTVRFPEGTPAYVAQALDKIGYAVLAQHGRAVLAESKPFYSSSAAGFAYDCTLAFCELAVDVRGRHSSWVLFGATPQVFDAGGALEALLEADFHELGAVASGGGRRSPLFYRSAGRVLAPFMASELNQAIVDARAAGKSDHAIVETTSRAVSLQYVQVSLQYLRKTVRAATHWSRLKWGLALNLLAVPLVIPAFAYLHRDTYRSFAEAAPRYPVTPPLAGQVDWQMALLTLLVTVPGWLAALWLSRRWLKRAGGQRTVAWARKEKLLMGTKTGLLVMATAAALAGLAYGRWPLWIDGQGRAYGVAPLFAAPVILAPLPAIVPAPVRKKPPRRKKPPARHEAPVRVPEAAPAMPVEPAPARQGDGLF